MIDIPISEPTYPTDWGVGSIRFLEGLKKQASKLGLKLHLQSGVQEPPPNHQVAMTAEATYQPNIRLLPDFRRLSDRTLRWDDTRDWENRAAVSQHGYHLLYTQGTGSTGYNSQEFLKLHGTSFLVKLSPIVDNEERYYVDVTESLGDLRKLFGQFSSNICID